MDFKNLITATPNNGIASRQYIENIWKACDHEPHFFTYLMQTLHFLAHEFELLPPEQYTDEIEEAVGFANPMTGEFYSSYMSTFPDNPFGVCFGIRQTSVGAIEFGWFNIVRNGNKIYAFNPCRLKNNSEDSVSYLGIQIPTLMITKQYQVWRIDEKNRNGETISLEEAEFYKNYLPTIKNYYHEQYLYWDKK